MPISSISERRNYAEPPKKMAHPRTPLVYLTCDRFPGQRFTYLAAAELAGVNAYRLGQAMEAGEAVGGYLFKRVEAERPLKMKSHNLPARCPWRPTSIFPDPPRQWSPDPYVENIYAGGRAGAGADTDEGED